MKDFYNDLTRSFKIATKGSYSISGGNTPMVVIRGFFSESGDLRIRSEPHHSLEFDTSKKRAWGGFSEFREGLEQVLSSHLGKTEDVSARLVPAAPWLEIVLAFVSTTVATTLATKISEDIYYHFKGKLLKAYDKKETERETLVERLERLKAGEITEDTKQTKLLLSIRIDIGDTMHLERQCLLDNYSDAIDVIRSLPQIITEGDETYD